MSEHLIGEYQIVLNLCEEFMTTPNASFSYLIWAASLTHYEELPIATGFSSKELDSWAEGESVPSMADRIYVAILIERFFEKELAKLKKES